jgi:hypothetical protein
MRPLPQHVCLRFNSASAFRAGIIFAPRERSRYNHRSYARAASPTSGNVGTLCDVPIGSSDGTVLNARL